MRTTQVQKAMKRIDGGRGSQTCQSYVLRAIERCNLNTFAAMGLQNDLLLRAAKGEFVERVPVWLMRQAGRILPEYRAVRKNFSGFKAFVETPQAAAEVTVQPVDLLSVDAAIIFSDILVVPEAMGLPYQMLEKSGPFFERTIKSQSDVDALHVPDPTDKLAYVLEAIRQAKSALQDRVPLIGFAGAPFTILAYMVEGHGSKTFSEAKKLLYTSPAVAHALLQKITDTTIAYLQAQVEAGANLIQVFDSWAGSLGPSQYDEFSLRYIAQIVAALPHVPVTVFAKGAHFATAGIATTGCQTIGLDWTMDAATARAQAPLQTLQGNMDPCALYANPEAIDKAVEDMLAQFGTQRYIANLGHGLYPDTNPDHVRHFVQAVKEKSLTKQHVTQ